MSIDPQRMALRRRPLFTPLYAGVALVIVALALAGWALAGLWHAPGTVIVVRHMEKLADAGDDAGAWEWALQVRKMTGILGIDPLDEQWTSTDASAEASALDVLVQTMLAQRAHARAAKDWAAADRIRDAIAAAGIALEDGPDGTHWSLAGADSGAMVARDNSDSR